MPEMQEVYSNSVHSIGYGDGELHVRWARTGRISVYKGVPPDLANQIINAPSVGSALKNSIQGTFEHRYI